MFSVEGPPSGSNRSSITKSWRLLNSGLDSVGDAGERGKLLDKDEDKDKGAVQAYA
jgi:hypothetical protein